MTATAGGYALQALDLRFRYPGERFELRLPNLCVEAGERLALIGPSGSGKSTLLQLLAGILLPTSGRTLLGELEWSRLSEAARRKARITRIGLVFQEFELLRHLSVGENILLPYYVHPALELDRGTRERARELARRAGIESHWDKRPQGLSHGERQRVAFCRALVTRPEVILADEPTGSLDPESTAQVLELLLDEVSQSGTTLVVVTHDHELIPAFERVIDFKGLAGAEAAR